MITLNVRKQERNLCLSPINTTLERQGRASFIAFSIGFGAMFSPPAVIINSFIRPIKQFHELWVILFLKKDDQY